MNPEVFIKLADLWESESKCPDGENCDEDAKIENATRKGVRIAKRKCADDLRLVVDLLGH